MFCRSMPSPLLEPILQAVVKHCIAARFSSRFT
jgi:hypothetical protein